MRARSRFRAAPASACCDAPTWASGHARSVPPAPGDADRGLARDRRQLRRLARDDPRAPASGGVRRTARQYRAVAGLGSRTPWPPSARRRSRRRAAARWPCSASGTCRRRWRRCSGSAKRRSGASSGGRRGRPPPNPHRPTRLLPFHPSHALRGRAARREPFVEPAGVATPAVRGEHLALARAGRRRPRPGGQSSHNMGSPELRYGSGEVA